MRLLIIEDEQELCLMICKVLKSKGYSVDYCFNGEEGMELLEVENYDLVILDLTLPGMDGMTILSNFRQFNRETPVLILSALVSVNDKVKGLDAGASDYLTKPFHFEELEARIRSLTYRNFKQNDTSLKCGDITFDSIKRQCQINGDNESPRVKTRGILP